MKLVNPPLRNATHVFVFGGTNYLEVWYVRSVLFFAVIIEGFIRSFVPMGAMD